MLPSDLVTTDPSNLASLSRRAALAAFTAAGVGFALFGPRGKRESADGRIVLDYWEKWTGKVEGGSMEKIVGDFNRSQDRILVRYLSMAGIDEKTQIAIAGNSPPDVVGLWSYNVPGFAETGAILPFDELGTHALKPGIYAEGMRPITMHKGRMYAAINTGGTIALYYNRAMFKDAGLDPDRPPRTISELSEYCRKLARVEGGRLVRAGFHHREPGWWPQIWGYYFGGSLYDERANAATFDDAGNVASLEWVQSFVREYGVERLNELRSSFGNYDSPLNAFVAGTLAMVCQGPWLGNIINLYRPDLDYAVAPMPVADHLYDPDAPIGMVDTDILVIPRGVKHPEASMEFIAFTQRQDNVEYLSTAHCKGSPLATSSEAFLANHPNRGIRTFDALAKSPRSFRVPSTRTWLQIRDEMTFAFDKAWNLQGTPKSILATARQRAQVVLDRAADESRRRGRA
jgi:ABC-type glycerol-3-phosphate transport system substrate-binding protein